jgi:hypothetical protein
MKYWWFLQILFIFHLNLLFAQQDLNYSDYFENFIMRVDYFHVGDAKEEFITIDRIYQQGYWAGSRKNLLDNFNNGRYYIKIYHLDKNILLFSKGFDSYFGEYKTSTPALQGQKRTYHESALFPFPKNKIRFVFERRTRSNAMETLFEQVIDPEDISILKESLVEQVKVFSILKNGTPQNKIDVAFIAEGYTQKQENEFKKDMKKFLEVFFSQEPYRSRKKYFNIYGVFKASAESGIDEPRFNLYKNTVLNATFNSLGSERYLLTEDNKRLRDIAAHAPYDALVIMVNHNRYGGGGIYNLFCTFTTKNQWASYLLLHEFGHSFAGLADEYYTSSTAYNEFYPLGIEPNEPNITALLNAPSVKWQHLLTPGIELPTPWGKEKFDEMDEAYQQKREQLNQKIAQLKKERADEKIIRDTEEEAASLSEAHARKMDEYLVNNKLYGKVGAFEGAGYVSKGLYRPMIDCIMFSKGAKPYCKVCEEAVQKMINHYTSE